MKTDKEIRALLDAHNEGIHVDLGGGQYPQGKDWLNIDNRDLKEVDVVHDLQIFPWPLPDECASIVLCSHLVEHIVPHGFDPKFPKLVDLLVKKKLLTRKEVLEALGETDNKPVFLRFMDECWRIMKPGGQLMITTPYAGSFGFWQDPTHINGCN